LISRVFGATIVLMEVLASGANFEITAERGVVRLTVVNRPEVDRDEGARCAQLIHDTLTSRVLVVRSQYRALVIDVRQGPEVFGPKTRASLEELFRAAESSRKRTAVRPGTSPIRRLQFASLCRECAPRQAKIVDDDHDENSWLVG
jgi:hypothetical protein